MAAMFRSTIVGALLLLAGPQVEFRLRERPAPPNVGAPAPGNTTIEVQVQDVESVAPISGAKVTLSGVADFQRAFVETPPLSRTELMTGNDGLAVFPKLAAGLYLVRAEKSINELRPSSIYLRVTANDTIRRTTLKLGSPGTISGRVVDSDGKPQANVNLAAMMPDYENGVPSMVLMGVADGGPSNFRTNDRGEYRMFGLPPGHYLIRVDSRPNPNVAGSVFPDMYYPNTANSANAVTVTVKSGHEVSNIDFRLQPSPTFKVSGRVIDNSAPFRNEGKEGRKPLFKLVPQGPGPVQAGRSINIVPKLGDDGTFELSGITPGAWNLYVMIQTQMKEAGQAGAFITTLGRVSLDIRDRDIEGLTVTVGGGTVDGRVVMDDGSPMPASTGRKPRFGLGPLDAPPIETGGVQLSAEIDESGKFALTDTPPNRYRVTVAWLPDNYYVSDIRLGGASIRTNPVVEVNGEALPSIDVVVNSNGGTVQVATPGVNAETMTTESLQSILVVLSPQSDQGPTALRAARLDPDGKVRLTGVPPGPYKLFAAITDIFIGGSYNDPKWREPLEKTGRTVMVERGKTLDVELDRPK
jgi:hypothetical protein